MSKNKFTPGPWSYKRHAPTGDCGIKAEGTGIFVECFADIRFADERNGEEVEANARLVAAAPDLYEALTAALKHILSEAEARTYDPPASPELVADIEAALAKAEGRS